MNVRHAWRAAHPQLQRVMGRRASIYGVNKSYTPSQTCANSFSTGDAVNSSSTEHAAVPPSTPPPPTSILHNEAVRQALIAAGLPATAVSAATTSAPTAQQDALYIDMSICPDDDIGVSVQPDRACSVTDSQLQQQLQLEMLAVEENVAAARETVDSVVALRKGAALRPVQRLLARWYGPLVQLVDAEQAALLKSPSKAGHRAAIAGHLMLVKPDKLAVLTMHESMSALIAEGGAMRVTNLAERIGRLVETEVALSKLKKADRREWAALQGPLDGKKMLRLRNATRKALEAESWNRGDCVRLGALLLDCLVKAATVEVPITAAAYPGWEDALGSALNTEGSRAGPPPVLGVASSQDQSGGAAPVGRLLYKWEEGGSAAMPPAFLAMAKRTKAGDALECPAFLHGQVTHGKDSRIGVLRSHPAALAALDTGVTSSLSAVTYPMIVPPVPWTSPKDGGYLLQRVKLLRPTGSQVQSHVLRRGARMPQVYEALTRLGAVPWRVNTRVLGVVEQVWADGGGIGAIPPLEDYAEPEPLAAAALTGLSEEEAALAVRRHNRSIAKIRQSNADLHSLRCDMELKLKVARMFKDTPRLYFPFNMDFRGRVYPVPPHLNHMGADMARGLLTFSHGKPLGEAGLRWLKIHLANLFGVDKVSRAERVAFAEENVERVRAVAAAPLEERWWLEADSPWQALATCFELAAALACEDPTQYSCSLPVHQDGSCNGLQHYAALGRDATGAAAVNLIAADKPQDVYREVLKLVLERIEADAMPGAADVAPADAAAAQFVRGQVDRKVVKQTVMTSVYGVTFVGAREQIQNRLKEKFDPAVHEGAAAMHVDELDDAVYAAAAYLARVTLGSLGQMFAAADAIKEWLGDAAAATARAGQPMAWVTPLGLPVVQPYRRSATSMVRTALQDCHVVADDDTLPVSVARQRSAFPPNYVHSLDSTHMMLTALDCTRRGLTFTAVHDSYWTHAADVDVMNRSLRHQFVRLYSQPLLESLANGLRLQYPSVQLADLPQRGKLDLKNVLDSPYFFA